MKIGRVTLSDRAFAGESIDQSGPGIEQILRDHWHTETEFVSRVLPDDQPTIESALVELAKVEKCCLIITTGGTGPSPRDVTPDATKKVVDRELPGFGEAMRFTSFAKVPTSILSRATAGVLGTTLIVNLPGNPKAVAECLPVILPAIRECLRHLGGDWDHPSQ
jgi:molybdopterin adenylyltransferase